MRRLFVPLSGMILTAACWAAPLAAQSAPSGGSQASATAVVVDPASLPMPEIAFQPTPDDTGTYDKYFIFHRDDTDFATAYADLQECDGYARGLSYRNYGGGMPYSPYMGVLGSAIGGAIGSAVADAVFGSAERRRLRRVNMRACMQFKGYQRFGLRKSLWEQFNFQEGNAHVEEARRQHLLQLQARVASGPRPQVGEIEP